MAGKLPELNKRDAAAFLAHFAIGAKEKSHNRFGGVRDGKAYLIELTHGRTMRPDVLRDALKYLGVSQDDFWEWYRSK